MSKIIDIEQYGVKYNLNNGDSEVIESYYQVNVSYGYFIDSTSELEIEENAQLYINQGSLFNEGTLTNCGTIILL